MARGHPAADHRDGSRPVPSESKYFAIDFGVHPLRQTENKYFATFTRTGCACAAVERSIRPDVAYFQSTFVFTLSVKQENKYFAISTRTGKKTPGWGQARGSIRKLKDIYFSV